MHSRPYPILHNRIYPVQLSFRIPSFSQRYIRIVEVPPRLSELLEVKEPEWVEILEESVNIEQTRYVHPKTSLTPLHLAIMVKDTENNGAWVAAIWSLLQSDLHGTEVQCG
jgi:hypothetical protein